MSVARGVAASGTSMAQQVDGYGGFTLGGMELALPMSALREVVPLQSLILLPCLAPGVVGGIELRGVVIPVVDLQIVLGRAAQNAPQPCVIVVVHGGRLLGLLADGITGVFSPPGLDADARAAHAGAALFAGSVCRADTGTMVSLLSPDALSRLPQVPMTEDPEPGRELNGAQSHASVLLARSMPVMLIRCGGIAMAIDALSVHATLSNPQLSASAVAMGRCRGVMDYDGRSIPAVDLLALCGMGDSPPSTSGQAFVMRFAQGLVGLLVDEVMDVIHIGHDDVVSVPAFALPEPALFAGALPASVLPPEAQQRHGPTVAQYLLLSGRALLDCDELRALSEVNVQHGERRTGVGAKGVTPGGTADEPARHEMITFELFGEEATPIEQVAEILRFDEQMAAFTPRGALVALVVNRGRTIPVMCLRSLAGMEPAPRSDNASVLVVRSDEDWVGFAVPRLRAIETARWSPSLPAQGLGEGDALAHTLQSRGMALMDNGSGERMLRVLDLAAIARGLRGQALAAA